MLVAAEDRYGSEVLDRLYTAFGELIHREKHPQDRDLVVSALAAADLDPALVDAMDDPAWDEVVHASHDEGMDQVGDDVGRRPSRSMARPSSVRCSARSPEARRPA